MPGTDDVLVVGGGPAGRAVAAACGRRGLRTTLLDPAPDRPWRATYAAWREDLPGDLPPGLVAARGRGRAVALTERPLGWEYVVLDVAGLREHLDGELTRAQVTVRTGRVAGVSGGAPDSARTVHLTGGGTARAAVLIDAGGRHQPLGPFRSGRRIAAEQTAFGVVVDAGAAAPLVAPGEALFMDWRRDHGEDGWPTFLYGIPLGSGAVLLEETSLARRPGLPLPDLRRRLFARLARHGIRPPAGALTERVRFPLDVPRHPDRAALGFGAAAPLVHPATGFSVGAALRLAPVVAAALAGTLPRGPAAALAAGRTVVWPAQARAVHALRRRGLEALLRMPAPEVPAFFEVFLGLPARHRWAYLTAREDLPATFASMTALFGRSSWVLRARLVLPGLLPALTSG